MAELTEKDKRYDRQLRLWGDHGQAKLESAHVCLIHATALGTETLKNLVLPGIGAFTIVDNHRVKAVDLGSNFFLTPDSLGQSRGLCATELLQELNTEVRSNHVDESLDAVLKNDPGFFEKFSIVIATAVPEDELQRLAAVLWENNTPLLIGRTYGLLGYLRLVVGSHEVIESHPDNYHEDLRLDNPFPALQRYANSIDLEGADNTKHGNVPYLILLLKYLEQWKSTHDGQFPSNYREKKAFKELIRQGIRSNEDGVPLDEDNFDEAIASVNSSLVRSSIPSEVQKIFEDQCCTCINIDSSIFWLLARALKEFVVSEGNGLLPLRGTIPDMTSSSDMYIQLQRIYQAQARIDMEALTSHLCQLLTNLNKPSSTIGEVEIKRLCRNSAFLRVVRCRSLASEYSEPNFSELSQLSNPDSELVYYVLLRAADQFYSLFKTYPGCGDNSAEADVTQLKSILSTLLQNWRLNDCTIKDEHVIEFCRYGAGELHSIASYVAGVASQEVIKILTHQYVPFCNTYLYNAATCSSVTVCL